MDQAVTQSVSRVDYDRPIDNVQFEWIRINVGQAEKKESVSIERDCVESRQAQIAVKRRYLAIFASSTEMGWRRPIVLRERA